jgi:Spy/CpxP family protein refolding chaperone
MKTGRIMTLLAVLVVFGASSIALAAGKDGRGPREGRGPRDGRGPVAGQHQQGGPGGMQRGGMRPEMGSGHMMGFGGFEKLDLTKEQREIIAEIRREAMKKMMADIKAVLTDEQLAELKKGQKGRDGKGAGAGPGKGHGSSDMFSKLKLTEDQQTEIDAIRKAGREEMQDADGREGREAIMKDMHAEINAVLTDEQVEKLEKYREKYHGDKDGGGPQWRRGGGDDDDDDDEDRPRKGKGRKGKGKK